MGSTQPEKWGLTSTLRSDHQAELSHRMQARVDDLRNHREDSCDYALTKAREAHQWVLVATALLEGKIKRLSQSVSWKRLTSSWHSCSHDHSRRWSRGCPRRCTKTSAGWDPSGVPSAMSHHGDHQGRLSGLPAPPDQEDGSLSKKIKLWLQKTLLWSRQSRCQVEVSQQSAT